jgi:hypothetical protein
MATERKIEPKLAEAAAKTTAVLETLRARLIRETTAPESAVVELSEAPDELSRELEQYFAATPEVPTPTLGSAIAIPSEIRAQVIEGVVDRILRSWGGPDGEIPAGIKSEVIGRLVEHVLAELLKKGTNTP